MYAIYNTVLKSYAYAGFYYTDVGAVEPTTVSTLSFIESPVIYVSTDRSELERIIVERNCHDDSYDDDTGEYVGSPRGSVENPIILIRSEEFDDCIIVELVGTKVN